MARVLFLPPLLLVFIFVGSARAAESGFKIQIGATRDLAGARYYAGKAAEVLGRDVYLVKERSGLLKVMVGGYASQSAAMDDYYEMANHYECMIVPYDPKLLLERFKAGRSGESVIVGGSNKGRGEDSGKQGGIARKEAPPPPMPRSEAVVIIESALEGVRVEQCGLKEEKSSFRYNFSRTLDFSEMDPMSVSCRIQGGRTCLLSLSSAGEAKNVHYLERRGEAVLGGGQTRDILFRTPMADPARAEKLCGAVRSLIRRCSARPGGGQ